ncbi:MAG: pilus assembly protein [Alphaproteobacteria bacterium]|jgi:Flp pilus assembly protein TadG|nr:pilus assembly protein [Alphaproteobacteria bacterium]|tara:strand:- start:137 stop:574 length:438 start_codon:yes stop_codon:yes gene_type:complete
MLLDQCGAIAIEFALVAPVLLTILFGIMQFGFYFYAQASVNNAVREAARQLAVGSATVGGTASCSTAADGTAEAVACNNLTGLNLEDVTVTACDPDNVDEALCSGADDVAVKVSIPRSSIAFVDILGLFDDGDLEAQVIMRKEGS